MKDLFTEADCDTEKFRFGETIVRGGGRPFISLARANEIFAKWLSAGRVVYFQQGAGDEVAASKIMEDYDTHRAILVCVEPIVRDSAESLLRDLAKEYRSCSQHHNADGTLRDLAERAKKLLKEGE